MIFLTPCSMCFSCQNISHLGPQSSTFAVSSSFQVFLDLHKIFISYVLYIYYSYFLTNFKKQNYLFCIWRVRLLSLNEISPNLAINMGTGSTLPSLMYLSSATPVICRWPEKWSGGLQYCRATNPKKLQLLSKTYPDMPVLIPLQQQYSVILEVQDRVPISHLQRESQKYWENLQGHFS